MSLIIKLFYLLSVFFIYVEVYGFFFRSRIYKPVSELELETPFKHFAFYFFKLIYLPWLFVGLFSHNWMIFLTPILMGLVSLISFSSKNDKLINLWSIVNFLVSVICLVIILYRGVFQ